MGLPIGLNMFKPLVMMMISCEGGVQSIFCPTLVVAPRALSRTSAQTDEGVGGEAGESAHGPRLEELQRQQGPGAVLDA